VARRLLLALGIILLATSLASANGGFKSAPAYPAPPAIPVQRAMIVYQDGIEMLIVESSFDTPSPDVGWILPLPAEPTSLQAGDSGMLRTVCNAIQPSVTGGLEGFVHITRMLLIVLLIWTALSMYLPRRSIAALLVVFVALVAASVLLPTLSAPRGYLFGDGIAIASAQRVGNYDATVLRADEAVALSQWLADQELAPLEASEQAIIDDYIARGWCFVVARLVREGDGVATPHPLVATFPVDKPVFPMKLTAIGRSDTRVELIVVADQQASADAFDCVAADSFHLFPGQSEGVNMRVGPTMQASKHSLEIGHPDAVEHMWDGCVVTKLQADLSPQQMDRDVEMTLSPLTPQRQHFYGERARHDLFVGILQLGGIAIALTTGIALRGGRKPDRLFVNAVAVLLVLAFASAAIARALLPVIPTAETTRRAFYFGHYIPREQRQVALSLIASGQLYAGITEQELAALLPEFEEEVEPPEGMKYRIERSPGNVALRTIDGETWFCTYGPAGNEHRLRLPQRKEPQMNTDGH